MTLYPGLGLPLRHYPREEETFYPLGLHPNCNDSHSVLLLVREVAMMKIMEQLTDKENWHNLIFNDEVVNQWRKESLERRNRDYWRQAIANGGVDPSNFVGRPSGIVDVSTFDYVCLTIGDSDVQDANRTSVSKSFGIKQITL
jgi:hypothetical protein